jgi:hypothetical protein
VRFIKQLRNMGIDELVPNACPVFTTADDPRLVKDGQVLGDVLLDTIDGADELLNGCRAFAEVVNQLDSERLTENT